MRSRSRRCASPPIFSRGRRPALSELDAAVAAVEIDQRIDPGARRRFLDLADEDAVGPETMAVDPPAEEGRLGVDQARRAFAAQVPAGKEAQGVLAAVG